MNSNPETPKTPREELELKLTALLLGELPAAQAFLLREVINRDPELSKLSERLKKTIEMVRETEHPAEEVSAPESKVAGAPEVLKMGDEKRQKLLAHFKTVKPVEFEAKPKTRVSFVAIAAMIALSMILASMLLPALSKAKSRAQRFSMSHMNEMSSDSSASSVSAGIQAQDAAPLAESLRRGDQHKGTQWGTERQGDKLGFVTAATTDSGSPATYSVSPITLPDTKEDSAVSITTVPHEPQSSKTPDAAAPSTFAFSTVSDSTKAEPAGNRKLGRVELPRLQQSSQSNLAYQWGNQDSLNDSFSTLAPKPSVSEHQPIVGNPVGGYVNGAQTTWNFGTGEPAKNAEGFKQTEDSLGPSLRGFYDDSRKSADRNYQITAGVEAKSTALKERNITPMQPPRAPALAAPGGNTVNFANRFTTGTAGGTVAGKPSTPEQVVAGDKPDQTFGGQGGGGGGGGGAAAQPSSRREALVATLPTSKQDTLRDSLAEQQIVAGQKLFITNGTYPNNSVGDAYFSSDPNTRSLVVPGDQTFLEKAIQTQSGIGGGRGGVAERRSQDMPKVNASNQIPTLGEVPVLGRLFRNENQSGITDNSGKEPSQALGGRRAGEVYLGNADEVLASKPIEDMPLSSSRAVSLRSPKDGGSVARTETAITEEEGRRKTVYRTNDVHSLGADEYAAIGTLSKQTPEQEVFRKRYGLAPGGLKEPAQKKTDIAQLSESLSRKAEGDAKLPVPQPYARSTVDLSGTDREKIERKLGSLEVSNAFLGNGLPLAEVARELSEKSKQVDPYKKGINFIIQPSLNQIIDPTTGLPVADETAPLDPTTGLPVAGKPATLDVGASAIVTNLEGKSVRLADALEAIVKSSELPIKYKVEDYGVVLSLDDSKISATQLNKQQNKPAVQDEAPAARPKTPAPIPQPEVQTTENAFSTFSLNVSDVSFKLAGASLEKGQLPDPAGIRSEEFINAFDYRDPEPPAGVPIGFAWERARYPFAQNRDLLRFSVKTAAQGRQAGRPLNIVLLLDNSGSMERADRVQIIHEALKVLASQLNPQDTLSVVTFARTARLWVDGVPGSQAAQVAENLSGLSPEGGTNLEEAMRLAYDTARRHYLPAGINRVVLLTDGAANLGNVEPEQLKQGVEAHRKEGIALDCFGIGWEGYNDDLLEVLSRNGDGRYGFINTPEEAATEFAGQLAGALQVAASDVKVQVEFNPARVTSYRQIGYAKHQLTKEQFRDNTVDAAEIGAAESGNALYTIEVNPAGNGPLGTVRVRYKVPGTTDYREHEWTVPFNGNATALEQASPAMRLAGTASAFSEWLASSPYAAEVSVDGLLGYLSGVPAVYGADARPQKLEWMIRQAISLAGK